jgi:hypothetical protein
MNGNSKMPGAIERVLTRKSMVLRPKCCLRPLQEQDISLAGRHPNKELKNIGRRVYGSIRKMKKWRNREAIATK